MYDSDRLIDRDRRSAIILRAAAIYIERNGYFIPRLRLYTLLDPHMDNPDFDWDLDATRDESDTFDPTFNGPNPPVSETGAIAMVIYGWPNTSPTDDGSNAYQDYRDAVSALHMHYAPDGDGYGEWIYPDQLAAAMRATANDCDRDADRESRLRHTWGE